MSASLAMVHVLAVSLECVAVRTCAHIVATGAASGNRCLATSNRRLSNKDASSNRCHAGSSRCLTIQSKLRANHCCCVIARPCFVEAAHKGQLKGEAKAIRVPRGRNDKLPPQAFSFHTEVRHVPVEPGMRIVGEAAWRSCRQLQVVHLPDTVVSLLHGAFSRYRALRAVIASGCQHFGAEVFEECCSPTQIGVTQCPGNMLALQAQLRPRVFQGCTALQRPRFRSGRARSDISEPKSARSHFGSRRLGSNSRQKPLS